MCVCFKPLKTAVFCFYFVTISTKYKKNDPDLELQETHKEFKKHSYCVLNICLFADIRILEFPAKVNRKVCSSNL